MVNMAWYYVYLKNEMIGRTQSFKDARRIAVQFCNSNHKRIQIYKQSKFTKEYHSPYVVDFWTVRYEKVLDTGRKVTFLHHEWGDSEKSRMLDGSGGYYRDTHLKEKQKRNEKYWKEMGFL